LRVLAYFISLFFIVVFMLGTLYFIDPAFREFHKIDAIIASEMPQYGPFKAEPNTLIIPDVNGTDYTANVIDYYGADPTSKVYDVHSRVWMFHANLSGKCLFIVPYKYDIGIRNISTVMYFYNSGVYGYKTYQPWEEVWLTPNSIYAWGLMEHPRPGSTVVSFMITVSPWLLLIMFFGMIAVFIYTRYR